ncbi:jasmonate-induced oxygenase 4-like isoform X1 [Musa acuminata AAA Group]|uniref:jasmonate-induced oxygenase 4-like isoform X1 n=2 Tax=Musa acuminata AAA Group TaxID=214697 RepID=UPI0031CE15DA
MASSPLKAMLPPPEFRAPPPSPVAGVHPHGLDSPDGDDEFAGFLSHSLRVPKLNLPHRIFPQEATAWNPPAIDFQPLISPGDAESGAADLVKSAAAAFGCFQLVNHGISPGLVAAVGAAACPAFGIPLESRTKAARSPERRWGFEVEEEGEGEEFLWWCRSGMGDRRELAAIWPRSYKDFSDKVEGLWCEIQKIASRVEEVLLGKKAGREEEAADGSLLCLHKHAPNGSHNGGIKHELLRMLVRSWSCSCDLSLHLPGGASEFHIYSKRGWYRFCPENAAIVVTVGDQIQACSGGFYKHVIGKPVLKKGDPQDSISMAFHHTTHQAIVHGISRPNLHSEKEKTISLAEQIMVAACLAIAYHIIAFFFCRS